MSDDTPKLRLAPPESAEELAHRFEREQGFFQGAMYVSWILGVTYLAALAILAQLLLVPRVGIALAVLAVVIIHVLCIPIVFRYSRVIWAHLNACTTP